ncbi:MAG: toll/interleukin-1 receptor domain-containing protein [Blastocatellia bacterium]|nr:toll/interleukin-1 receptor domain-containing protein [Blastocatellia bacterium]
MEQTSAGNRLIFISHSSKDTWVARQIAREVSLCGATPFLDEADVEVGEDFEEKILGFLEQAHELLVLLTPWALDRPYVWAELGAAWGRRIHIVGILHGMTPTEFQSRPGIPVFIKKRDLLDINDIDLYLQQLKARAGANINDSGGFEQ